MIVWWFLGFKFKLLYWELHFNLEHKREHEFLSNARERPTRTASGKHGRTLTWSLDLPEAPRVCRGPLRVCRARSVAPREPHAQGCTSRTRRAHVYPMLLCFVVIRVLDWTRACVRCARRHETFHRARACFSQRALNKPYRTHTHTLQMERRALVPISVRVVLHEARRHAHSSLPRDRHDATSYHAIPSDADLRSTRLHIRDVSRARVPDVTRVDGHERAIPGGHIDEAQLHVPQTIPSTRVT